MEPKRFSLTKLESARSNPIDFGSQLKNEEKEQFGNSPKSVRWLNAIGTYHSGSTLSESIMYLQNSFINRKQTKKNIAEVEMLVKALTNYTTNHTALDYTYYTHRLKMEINLSDKLKTTGWIWLINKTNDGYAGYIIVNDADTNNWHNQLRFPIIQNYMAKMIFKCPVESVEVGIINYYEGIHHKMNYSKEDIKLAMQELKFIGNEISSLF